MTTMTSNRFSTHGPDVVGGDHICPYKKCKGRGFKSSQALSMHVGRVHTKTIPTASSQAVSRGLASARNARNGNLSDDEASKLVDFICQYRDVYPTKKAAFDAALDAVGLTGKIRNNSSSVDRYWKKAMALAKKETPKRKYKKRAKEPTIPVIATKPNTLECVVTGPGLRLEFSARILPTILHTIAMSIGEEK